MVKEESVWVEFEVHFGSVELMGYMNLDEADDESPLCFYDFNGFDIGHQFPSCPFHSALPKRIEMWNVMVEWFTTTDIVQWLVDFAFEEKVKMFRVKSRFNLPIYLYINTSAYECNNEVRDKTTTIRVKQSTKEQLKKLGGKGQTYDEIIRSLLE